MLYPALLPLMRTPRLPVVDWTDVTADLNGLVCFVERRNVVSGRVPSHFNWLLHIAERVGLAPVVLWRARRVIKLAASNRKYELKKKKAQSFVVFPYTWLSNLKLVKYWKSIFSFTILMVKPIFPPLPICCPGCRYLSPNIDKPLMGPI